MESVFVTGANGLLGTNLILMLLEQNYFVVAFVRKRHSFVIQRHENLKIVEGELQNEELLIKEIQECKFVVHIAANTSQKLLSLSEYYSANVLGTQNVMKACVKNHIKKMVYIGTANSFGYGNISNPGNENLPMKPPYTKLYYALSKNQAQGIIDKASSKLNITTICPTFMLGAYDSKPSSGRIILMALNKRFVFYPSGGKNFVHVNDVAKAIIKSLYLKQSGQKFILANENLSYKDFFKKVIHLNNQKTKLIPLPNLILMLLGVFGDFCRFFKHRTELSSVNVKVLTINNYYTNKKALQALNLESTPIDRAIISSLDYFKQNTSKKY
ncbi:NAD-dependent epimerase/dehydratase family protein [Algoriphagus sp. AGSA1]|uniref:NAD-dependent epimerase/dehydratase family protein n=1 Tax=Algoriphagus sp. AGSA1 TaxID=2907213 RepID=UPI001F168750|nr:NAD-dependent epimerase/dehydratase family protein [Algoriphagus sp. AGSA1]